MVSDPFRAACTPPSTAANSPKGRTISRRCTGAPTRGECQSAAAANRPLDSQGGMPISTVRLTIRPLQPPHLQAHSNAADVPARAGSLSDAQHRRVQRAVRDGARRQP
jgi:hypothetical protein